MGDEAYNPWEDDDSEDDFNIMNKCETTSKYKNFKNKIKMINAHSDNVDNFFL